MYRPLRPSDRENRPQNNPQPGAVSVVVVAAFLAAALAALSPMLALSGVFAAAVSAVAARESP